MKRRLAEVKDRKALAAPVRVICHIPQHGTLQIGAPADLSMLEVVEGPVSFVDTRSGTRQGKCICAPWGWLQVWRLDGRNSRRSGPG